MLFCYAMACCVHFHLLIFNCLFLLTILTLNSSAQISNYRLCGDSECKNPVSIGRTLIRYHSPYQPLILSFNANVPVKIFSKSAGSIDKLWGGEIDGKRGYFPREYIREDKILIKNLNFNVSTEEPSAPKSSVNAESKTDDKTLDSGGLVQESPNNHYSDVKGISEAVEKQVENGKNDENMKWSKVEEKEEEKSSYSFVQSAWDTVKSNKFMTMSIDGIQSVAEFTNQFPESISKLSDHLLRSILTSAQEIPESTPVQSTSEENTKQVSSAYAADEERLSTDDSKYLSQKEANDSLVTSETLMSSISSIDASQISVTPSLSEMPHTVIKSVKENSDETQQNYDNDSSVAQLTTDQVVEVTQTLTSVNSKDDVNDTEIAANISGNVNNGARDEEKDVKEVTETELNVQLKNASQNQLPSANLTDIENASQDQLPNANLTDVENALRSPDELTSETITSGEKIYEDERDTKLQSKGEIISKGDYKYRSDAQSVPIEDSEAENVSRVEKNISDKGPETQNESRVEKNISDKDPEAQNVSRVEKNISDKDPEAQNVSRVEKNISDKDPEAENVSRVEKNISDKDAEAENVSSVESKPENTKEKYTNSDVSQPETTDNIDNEQDIRGNDDNEAEEDENEDEDEDEDEEEDVDSFLDNDNPSSEAINHHNSQNSDDIEVAYGDGMTQMPIDPQEELTNAQKMEEMFVGKTEASENIAPTPTSQSHFESLSSTENNLVSIDDISLNTESVLTSQENNFTPEIDEESMDSNINPDTIPSVDPEMQPIPEEQEENTDFMNSDKSEQLLENSRDQEKWTEYNTDDTLVNASWSLLTVRDAALSSIAELGTYMQWIIELLPEPLQASLHEQKEKIAPRAMVFTAVTGFLMTCLLSAYFFVKTRSTEDKLILKLCQLNKKQFELTAERDILKEDCLLAIEKINTLETNLANVQKSSRTGEDELDKLKERNLALQESEIELKEEFVITENYVTDLKEEVAKITKQHADLKLVYDREVEKCRQLDLRVTELENDVDVKETQETKNEKQISSQREEISELKESNAQLLQEAQVWNERVQELQNQFEMTAQSNEHLTTKLNTKHNEVEMLKETLSQIEALELENDTDSKSDKLQKLMDVSAITAELNAMILAKQSLLDELNRTMDKCKLLQDCMDELSVNNDELKQRDQQLTQERDEAVTKLQVLTDYFKEKEIELQRKLGFQEAKRQQTEESAESISEKAALYEQEVVLHKTHVESLKKELENQARSFKSQIAQHENKSHENWLAARAAERKSDEARQEAAMLRNKLTLLEQEKEAMTRAQGDGLNTPPTRHHLGNNGEILNDAGDVDFTSPLDLSRRLPFLPLDRPLPPPPQFPLPPPPPFERMSIPPSVFEMHGPLGPPPMMPFDPRMPLPPPLAPHFGDGRMPSPPIDRRLTPPRDFRSGGQPGRRPHSPPSFGPPGRRPASPPSYMRRPPSGRRMSPPRMPGDRFHESAESHYHQPSPPRFLERRTPPVKHFTETPPAKIVSTGIPLSHDKNKPSQHDTSSV